ncbi:hypothetical protein C4K00_4405 [Pseudomonas synxantha]|uniref:Uncharacterized protein n=1 Tax=Pseudomonas synxantha TaxID=47883 RepID=A0AAU8TJ56_9PSED|nr:hypothetical protein VO64_1685 [Pseudomonas synxantha]AZE74607.1 hypothetical protein C4K00_4405 [Pseudomonas synxantha]AZE80208.1 hypothetical protein C4J99_4450 [Pseudomonas synxantha]
MVHGDSICSESLQCIAHWQRDAVSAYTLAARFIQSMTRLSIFACLAIAANVPKAPLLING